jgi:hypothetical protein
LAEHVIEILQKFQIDPKKCIGNSTDGAGNMQGEYEGFSAWLSKEAPNQIHTWCFAHQLNLVIVDITSSCLLSSKLFSLMNSLGVFINESYKRMNLYRELVNDPKKRRITTVGETRWWAKAASLKKVFGNTISSDGALHPDVVHVLEKISEDPTYPANVRNQSQGYINQLTSFELIMTAFLFVKIFESTTAVSNYLQTKNANFVTAIGMIKLCTSDLKNLSSSFNEIRNRAIDFANSSNKILTSYDCDSLVSVEFSNLRGRRSADKNPVDSFKTSTFEKIVSQTETSIAKKFADIDTGFAHEINMLNPALFQEILESKKKICFPILTEKLKLFKQEIQVGDLESEFLNFANNWENIRNGLDADTNEFGEVFDVDEPEDFRDETAQPETKQKCCKNCVSCAYLLIFKYNLFCTAYSNVALMYEFVLTLSITQVQCERAFSTLKFIKNRLRSMLGDENFEALLLMNIHKAVLHSIDPEKIINMLGKKSALMHKLLII